MFQDKEKYLILLQKRHTQHQHIRIKKTLAFKTELAANTHTNYSSMCVVLSIQIKATDKAQNVDVITVSIFFCHW